MHQHLFRVDTAIRLSAGEAITVIFTRCNLACLRTIGESEYPQESGLDSILIRMKEIEKNIGEDHRKSKKHRTEQRSEFREYLKIISVRATDSTNAIISHQGIYCSSLLFTKEFSIFRVGRPPESNEDCTLKRAINHPR